MALPHDPIPFRQQLEEPDDGDDEDLDNYEADRPPPTGEPSDEFDRIVAVDDDFDQDEDENDLPF